MQYKVVRYDNFGFLSVSAVCLLSTVCLLSSKSHLEASDHETAQSKDVDNENLDLLTWSTVCLLSAVYLLFSKMSLTLAFLKKATWSLLTLKLLKRKDVNNDNLEFVWWWAVCLLFSNKPLTHFQCLNCSKFYTEPSFTQCGRSPREFLLLFISDNT